MMNKILLIFGCCSLVLLILSGWYIDHLRKDNKSLSDDLVAKNSIIVKFMENNTITERIGTDYENNISSLDTELERLLTMSKDRNFTLTSSSRFPTEQGPRKQYGPENGFEVEWFYKYSAEAERYRIERNTCKEFLNQIYEKRQLN